MRKIIKSRKVTLKVLFYSENSAVVRINDEKFHISTDDSGIDIVKVGPDGKLDHTSSLYISNNREERVILKRVIKALFINYKKFQSTLNGEMDCVDWVSDTQFIFQFVPDYSNLPRFE